MAVACQSPASPTPANLGSPDFLKRPVDQNFLDIPFKSRFHVRQYDSSNVTQVISDVQCYFVDHWPWKSNKECQSYLDADLEWVILLGYPDMLPERVRPCSIYIVWTILLDDAVGCCYRMLKEFDCQVEEVEEERESQSIDLKMMRDIFDRVMATDISDPGAPSAARNLCRGTCQWVLTTASISERKGAMHSPSLEAYLDFRVQDSGACLSKVLIAWGCGRPIKQHLWEESNLKLLDNLTSRHVSLVNDLVSYRRETEVAKQSDTGEVSKVITNAVAFIVQERALDEHDAIQFLWHYLSDLEVEMLKVEEVIKTTYSGGDLNEVERHIDSMKALCGRYNTPFSK
ncbi:isoprenoid synthase domain-containing protein [Crucibulum laeve]|uniref:Isoprenoid synthase domain-containing protein n=1 Tax=Crucibulum laeve TaxID=68775 RepID=A0A5C3LRY7_9AGAR|nr:isoprenoid synthase domain-containing protein [Crucibulum laeve]